MRIASRALSSVSCAKARARRGWQPEVDFPTLVRMMVDADLERVRKGQLTA